MKSDGSIVFSTALDNSGLERDLEKEVKKIEKTEQEIEKMRAERKKADESGVFKAAELDAEKAKLEEMRRTLQEIKETARDKNLSVGVRDEARAEIPQLQTDISDQSTRVRMLQAEYNKIAKSVETYDKKLESATAALDEHKAAASEIVDKINSLPPATTRFSKSMESAGKSINKFSLRLREVTRSALVFTLITQALSALRNWLGRVVTANDQTSAAIANLKGALLTLAQPLLSVVIPAFTAFVNVLTRIVTAVAGLLSMLFGKTIDQSKDAAKALNKEADALGNVGSAAKDAKGSLAGFDEINTINTQSSASAGASSSIAPSFDFDTANMEMDLERLLNLIELVGAAFLTWKLPNSNLMTFLGLIVAIHGAIELAKGAWDAWHNGLNGENLLQILEGALLLTLGLGVAFGLAGVGFGLIISGITMLGTAFHDALENGWDFQNLMLAIGGTMATGLGIAILTGSWLPLLIAGIASVLLALTVATGHGEELLEGIKLIMEGFVDFVTGVFTGDIEKSLLGIEKIFSGLETVVSAVIKGVKDSFLSFLTWLDEKTGGKFHGIIETAKKFITGFFDSTEAYATEFIRALKQIFVGIIEFLSGVFTNDWDRAWSGVKNIFKGVINGIITLFEAMLNGIISGLNVVISGIQKFTAFKLPDWMGGYSFEGINIPRIPKASIPRLATGAVIPPNREFLAVLGDQTSGNNIEAPESLIRQIVREESANSENTALLQAILDAIKSGKVMMVDKRVLARVAAEGINDMTIAAGKPVLLF